MPTQKASWASSLKMNVLRICPEMVHLLTKTHLFIMQVLTRPWLIIYMFTLFKVLIFHVKTLLKCRTLAYLSHLTHVVYMCVLFIIM